MVDQLPGTGLRVLIVDDMHDFANSMVLLLRLWNYDAMAVYDSVSAFDAAKTYLPHIALIDLMMPDEDGYSLANRLRHEPCLEHTALVAVTGLIDPAHRARCLQQGFVHFFEKPLDLREFQDVLAKLAGDHTSELRHGMGASEFGSSKN